MKEAVAPCFVRLPGDYYRQGYARVYINPQRDAHDLRVERTSFQDSFIASCLQSSLTTFRQKDGLPRSWSYAHIIAACDAKEVCGLTILLNNFAENEQLKILITAQTQRTFDPNSPLKSAVQGAFELIRLISFFSR